MLPGTNCPAFPPDNVWNTPINHLPVDASSSLWLNEMDGAAVNFPADYKGKVVMLDFWATWCGPCKVEIPWFMEFQRKYKDRGFEVLGVSMDDDGWKAITPYVQQKKINYRVVLGDDKTGDQYGGLEALPTTFVIDRNGRIASVHVGLTGKKDFSDAIEKLLEDSAEPAGGNSIRSDGADAHHRAGTHG